MSFKYDRPKICEYCGKEFFRRPQESAASFLARKKCTAKCVSETDAKTDVSVFRANPKEEAVDFGLDECHMFTRSWFTQNAHWRKHY